METIANIFLFIAGEALCIVALVLAARLGWAAIGNLWWDSYPSIKWNGVSGHYILNMGMAALALALVAISIAFAVTIPYILWGAA